MNALTTSRLLLRPIIPQDWLALKKITRDFAASPYWMYDYPDELKYVVDYLHDDNMRFLDFVEKEQLAVLNTDGVQVGAAGYGFCDDLPELTPETMEKPAALKDCWGVADSPESTVFSPDTFAEWFLPPIAEFANRFGHTSYCC